jgi:hypothetical protein
MKNHHLKLFLALTAVILSMLACEISASTANIQEANLALDPDGEQLTTTFEPGDVFYTVVELAGAPDDTLVKAVWVAVEVEGIDPNYVIRETELETGSGRLYFELSNADLWPAGQYKVDLFLNEELDRSLEFTVQ